MSMDVWLIMKLKNLTAVLVLSAGWGSLLLSVAFYLLFLRVYFEPGAIELPGLFWTAILLTILGGLAFLSGHIYLLVKKAWTWLWLAWLLCLMGLLGAFALTPVLLVFLV